MKVGDYVRTEDGLITKIKMFYEQKWEEPKLTYARFLCEDYEIYEYPRQVKSSPNIIDLIEVGDYVNGHKVIYTIGNINKKIYVEYVNMDELLEIKLEQITSIVTKEQFENMKYEVN